MREGVSAWAMLTPIAKARAGRSSIYVLRTVHREHGERVKKVLALLAVEKLRAEVRVQDANRGNRIHVERHKVLSRCLSAHHQGQRVELRCALMEEREESMGDSRAHTQRERGD